MSFMLSVGVAALLVSVCGVPTDADDIPEALTWPREIAREGGVVTVHQPQLETLTGNHLLARAAVAVQRAADEEPVFGAVWIDAQIETDRDARIVDLVDVEISDARFPGATEAQIGRLSRVLEEELEGWAPRMSLDHLLTALEVAESGRAVAEDLAHEPPAIVFVQEPTVLISVDGEPEMRPIDGSSFLRVVNSPFLIFFAPRERTYYMSDGARWLSAKNIRKSWSLLENPPAELAQMTPDNGGPMPDEDATARLLVVTEPTELIVTDGEPALGVVEGTALMYWSNTEDDVFRHVDEDRLYVLLSGRWFAGPGTSGPWTFVPAHDLPDDFGRIPADSAKGDVLAHVAGTPQAEDAVHDASIPQTSAVDRSVTIEVVYDGLPSFQAVEDLDDVEYAVNTTYAVFRTGGTFYCCHEGVWYVAKTAKGAWAVCAEVPDVLYAMPPSCPHYAVRYVYVYDATPEVVYVGYLPGYTGCYVYGGTVVYGTGYVYRGWAGRAYYPRPVTYGFAVRYNPYTGGWAVRVGYRGSRVYGTRVVAVGPYGGVAVAGGVTVARHGGWWGFGGYRPSGRYGKAEFESTISTPRGDITREIEIERGLGGTEVERTLETPRGTWRGETEVDWNWDGSADVDREVDFEPSENVYERREQARERGQERADARARGESPLGDRAAQRGGDLYADREGNVYRRGDAGQWERRTDRGWAREPDAARTPAGNRGAERPERRNLPDRPAAIDRSNRTNRSVTPTSRQRDLSRHQSARTRGNARTRNYQRTAPRRSMGGGARRGGGRR